MHTRGMNGPRDDTPEQSADDTSVGWGDDVDPQGEAERDDEWYLAERPPHHGT